MRNRLGTDFTSSETAVPEPGAPLLCYPTIMLPQEKLVYAQAVRTAPAEATIEDERTMSENTSTTRLFVTADARRR